MNGTAGKLWLIACLAVAPASGQVNGLQVPEGFTVEVAARPGLVERPMLASFDDRGRLYVADSAGLNLKGDELQKDPPNFIRQLEDADGDGVFDSSKVFADKMVFPQGVAWHDGSVYVSSPPNFWRLQDTDGDGVADKREILATGFPLTGISDDMHGASLGPDGRIYWFCGRFPHEIRRPGGPIVHKGTAPLMLRCRPDGSELEVVCGTHGNCVGAAFTPEGEPFACGTFLAPNSMGAGLRDAIIHCVEGAEYPVRDRVLNEHKRTGDLMPPLTHLGVAAAAGLAIYRDRAFGVEYEGNLFSALFNLHKVVRHVLERDGATFKCRNEDFLVSTNSDFHPTDVLEDADGSLLVLDTGGWFRNGCPTSQIAKPDVQGAIYRIRRKGAPHVADPRGLKLKWSSLTAAEITPLLNDPRFAVRDRAIQRLAELSTGSLAALKATLATDPSVEARRNAIWALTRMEGPASVEAVRVGLSDHDASVRQTAANSVGISRDAGSLARLMEQVQRDTPPVRREAATALGRIGSQAAVPALLAGLRGTGDRFLEHAMIFALIRIDDPAATAKGLEDADAATRRGALIALDQMVRGKLTPETVTPFLTSANQPLRSAALWVIAHHPDWGAAMAGTFDQWLAKPKLDEKQGEELSQHLLAFSRERAVQQLVARKLHDDQTPPALRVLLLEIMGRTPLDKLPESWSVELASSLANPDEGVVRQAIATIRSAPVGHKLLMQRVDPELNFAPARRGFGGTKLNDHFFARWTGVIQIPEPGTYHFTAEADDVARLLIDGQLIVVTREGRTMKPVEEKVDLAAGSHSLRVELVQTTGEAGCKIWWTAPGASKEILPARVLFHHKSADEDEAKGGLESGLLGQYYDLRGEPPGFLDPDKTIFDEPLAQVAMNRSNAISLRVEALAAAAPLVPRLGNAEFDFLTACLDPGQPPLVRLAAADAMNRAPLVKAQLIALTRVLPKAGALEMARLIGVYERSQATEVGRQLIAALERASHLPGLRADVLRPILNGYPPEVARAAEPLLTRLCQNLEQQRARLEQLKPVLTGGDVQRGHEMFFGNKAACFACHSVQGHGGHVGPDLSRIGGIRAPPDLLEAIVFPSASFARGFEPYLITTKDEELYAGIIGRETADAIYLYNSAQVETRIPRANIKELRPGTVSVMPEGLDAQLTGQELGDIITFLGSLR